MSSPFCGRTWTSKPVIQHGTTQFLEVVTISAIYVFKVLLFAALSAAAVPTWSLQALLCNTYPVDKFKCGLGRVPADLTGCYRV